MKSLPELIPYISITISILSFIISFIAFISTRVNSRYKLKYELLTKISDAEIRYRYMNKKYEELSSKLITIPAEVQLFLDQYKQFERNTRDFYDDVKNKDYSIKELELIKHNIDSMILEIENDLKRLNEYSAND